MLNNPIPPFWAIKSVIIVQYLAPMVMMFKFSPYLKKCGSIIVLVHKPHMTVHFSNSIHRIAHWNRNLFRCWRWFFDFTIYSPNLSQIMNFEQRILFSDLPPLFILIVMGNSNCHMSQSWKNLLWKTQTAKELPVIIVVRYIHIWRNSQW